VWRERLYVFWAAAGVYDPETRFFDPDRQLEEPLHPFLVRRAIVTDLGEEGLVLSPVLLPL
jgi:hypothetical protein